MGSSVGGGNALGVLDRGWEAAWVAVDGEQELRAGKRNAGEKKCLSG
jgi:hypothetical protein